MRLRRRGRGIIVIWIEKDAENDSMVARECINRTEEAQFMNFLSAKNAFSNVTVGDHSITRQQKRMDIAERHDTFARFDASITLWMWFIQILQ